MALITSIRHMNSENSFDYKWFIEVICDAHFNMNSRLIEPV